MKYTFETESDHEALMIIQAQRLSTAIWEFRQYLRSQRKYHDESNRDDIHGIETSFNNCFEGIDFDN